MTSTRFSNSVKAMKKTDNAAHGKGEKVAIRRNVLDGIGPESARVFEAFAGSGNMWRAVWRNASVCVGCDLRMFLDDRTAFVADNLRVMRCVDLSEFNIFDLDAYGCPWDRIAILVARRRVAKGERIGLVYTDGSRMKLNFGGLPFALADIAGVSRTMTGANRSVMELQDRAIAELCRRWSVRVVSQWRAESHNRGNARPVYVGLILEGV